jgi:hypothetical protein
MKLRENLGPATNFWGHRSKRVKKERIQDAQGISVEDSLQGRRRIIEGREAFADPLKYPEGLEGNVLTYGWILCINTFCRQLSLMTCVVFSTSFPPFGAAGQSLVFLCNFLLIAANQPYASSTLNAQEGLMMACMGALTFCATFKELLSYHKRAPDYPLTIQYCSSFIDCLVLFIICIIGTVIFQNVAVLAVKVISSEDATVLLNRVHYERVMAAEELESKAEDLGKKKLDSALRDHDVGGRLLEDIHILEARCTPDQWGAFRQGTNTILQLYNQSLEHQEEDYCPLDDYQMEMYGIRPTTQAMHRRKNSGVFTDLISKALVECSQKFSITKDDTAAQEKPFKGLAGMLVAATTREVGEPELIRQLTVRKTLAKVEARLAREKSVSQLVNKVVNQRERKKNIAADVAGPVVEETWDPLLSTANEDLLWDEIGPMLGGDSFTDWDAIGPTGDDEALGNWWDDIGSVGQDSGELGPTLTDLADLGPMDEGARGDSAVLDAGPARVPPADTRTGLLAALPPMPPQFESSGPRASASASRTLEPSDPISQPLQGGSDTDVNTPSLPSDNSAEKATHQDESAKAQGEALPSSAEPSSSWAPAPPGEQVVDWRLIHDDVESIEPL